MSEYLLSQLYSVVRFPPYFLFRVGGNRGSENVVTTLVSITEKGIIKDVRRFDRRSEAVNYFNTVRSIVRLLGGDIDPWPFTNHVRGDSYFVLAPWVDMVLDIDKSIFYPTSMGDPEQISCEEISSYAPDDGYLSFDDLIQWRDWWVGLSSDDKAGWDMTIRESLAWRESWGPPGMVYIGWPESFGAECDLPQLVANSLNKIHGGEGVLSGVGQIQGGSFFRIYVAPISVGSKSPEAAHS